MMLYSFLGALCLVMLSSDVEARLLNPSIVWKKLTESHLIKSNAVKHMAIDELDSFGSPFLLRGRPMPMGIQMPKDVPFSWKSCGPSNQAVDIRSLTISPSPLSFPGDLTFGFDIMFHETISSDRKVSAAVKIEVDTGSGWIPIPCIGQIGSCTYTDICSLLQRVQCPADLTAQGIPCNCPFNKGEYKLQKYSVRIDAAVIPSGDYKAVANLTESQGTKVVGCYELNFSVES